MNHMRDSAPKLYLRDPSASRADIKALIWIAIIVAVLMLLDLVRP